MSGNLKRLNDSDLNGKVKKLKRSNEPLDILSESGPLTQEDVVYYQKEAIFRLLNSIKIKNKKLYRELDKINNNYLIVFKYYSILNNWWFQILDNFKNFFSVEDINDLKDSSLLIDFNILEKNISNGGSDNNNSNNNNNESDKELLSDLNDKRIKLITLLNKLFSNNGLKFNNSETDKDNKLLSLQNSLTNLNVLKTNLESENDLLKQSVNDLNDQLDSTIRSNDKSDSKTLKRVSGKLESEKLKNDLNSKSKTEHSEINNINNDTNKDNKNSSINDNESNNTTITNIKDENGNEIKHGNGSRSGNGNVNDTGNDTETDNKKLESKELNSNSSELEDLKLEIIELNGKNNSLNEKLNEKLNKIIELENNINELTDKLNNLTEKDLIKLSTNYQLLIKKNEDLNININILETDKKKLESQLFELESKLTLNQKNLEEKFKSEIDSNSNYILKLENDINRIRSDRDELQSKISILKAEKGKSELTEEYKNLNEILIKRIDELENNDKTNSIDADVDINSNENNVETLIKHNKILSNELKQLEEAFKSTRIIASNKLSKYSESEFFINKLQIEKNKADEKYFQAMRSKDSLSSQNKILNSNLTKQSELIEILKINEKNLHLKLELESLMYKKLNEIETFYNIQLSKEKLKSKDFEIKFKTNLNNNSDLQLKLTKKQSIIDENERKIISLESNYEGIKSKFSNLENLIQKYRSNSRTEEDEEINQALLSMTKCSLCNKNFKNIALKVCGHCFCSSCVEDRLNARMRKCPNCNQQFSKYDLLSIHL